MNNEEMIRIAKIAVEKRMDYETLKYSDYLYGKEYLADEVWELVEECDLIGHDAFWTKYP